MSEIDKTAPETIYLQIGDDELCTYKGAIKAGADISWCADNVFPYDVEYIRADAIRELESTVARLEDELEQYRWVPTHELKEGGLYQVVGDVLNRNFSRGWEHAVLYRNEEYEYFTRTLSDFSLRFNTITPPEQEVER